MEVVSTPGSSDNHKNLNKLPSHCVAQNCGIYGHDCTSQHPQDTLLIQAKMPFLFQFMRKNRNHFSGATEIGVELICL